VSGIAGIFARNGGSVSRSLLQEMTDFQEYRGPDAQGMWYGGICGLSHTLLRTTRASENERQPATLDGLRITADVRLDSRDELKAEIEATGCIVPADCADCDLVLHAYACWGERCVERLRGEFAFAIWDSRRETLFCARDHFGIKPFYYGECDGKFIFSNTLDCVRLHPGISDRLNEAAVGDFLLFGVNWNPATTTWRDVQRLPAAHCLTLSATAAVGGAKIARYWSAPTDGCVRYQRAEDYVEHFREVFRNAAGERLSPECTGIFLSGGMDSSSIAAMAREICDARGGSMQLRAYTVISKSAGDSDTPCARKVAQHLRIPMHSMNFDDLRPFEGWDDTERRFPEPAGDPLGMGLFEEFEAVAKDCRVVLNGEGSDNLMHFQMWPYARHLARSGEWKRFCGEGVEYLRVRPFPRRGIRYRLRRFIGKEDSGTPAVPQWIQADFAKRTGLDCRIREGGRIDLPERAHPLFPKAHASMGLPLWSRLFEMGDSGVTRCPVETRFPFLDLRVVKYLLALPPFPWAFQKRVLRDAMRGRLPDSIVRRPKTPLDEDPSALAIRGDEIRWIEQDDAGSEISQFIDQTKLQEAVRKGTADELGVGHALCLKFWLRQARDVRRRAAAEVSNA